MVILLSRAQTLPSAFARRPPPSATACAGPSLAGVARRVSPSLNATRILALLARPSAASPVVETALIVLTLALTRRAVSVFCFSRYLRYGSEGSTVGGGCTVGSPLGDNVANGKNCKALPNVDQVSCDNGACTVISCKGDFDVSPQKDGCVQRGIKRVRKTRGAEVVDDVFDRLVSHKLLADWFNIAAGKAKIFATISVLNYNNVLLFLLNQNAIVGAPDLSTLRNMLDLGASQLRRDSPYTVDGVLNVLFQRNLIIRCSDIPCIKGFLGTNIEVLIISDLLQLLVSQGFIVQGTDILDLKQMFGLA